MNALNSEKNELEIRRDSLIRKLQDTRRTEKRSEDDFSVYNFEEEMKFTKIQLDRVTGRMELIRDAISKDLGQEVSVGDCLRLADDQNEKIYYLTDNSECVDPRRGIISSSSPLGEVVHIKVINYYLCNL
jgi:transcription elongation GreA/GreB family factor